MQESTKQRLTSTDTWIRGLYMVFFAIAYSLAELVILFVVLFQFLSVLFSGRANDNLLRLGGNLSAYVYQVLQFETFNSEVRPFPFSDWPDETIRENVWSDRGVAQEESTMAEDEPAARSE